MYLHFVEKNKFLRITATFNKPTDFLFRFIIHFQVEPSGDQKICTRCDLLFSNFKLLESTLLNLHQRSEVSAVQAPIPSSQPLTVNQTPDNPSQQTFASTARLSASASTSQSTVSNPTTGGPPEKMSKVENFAINDKVLYFDWKTQSMRDAVITQIVGPKVCKIVNEEKKIFHINSIYLTKL